MRRVKTFKWERREGSSICDKIDDGEGIFIKYGTNFEQFESGAGNFTTAIVEMPDGTVRNLNVMLIQFLPDAGRPKSDTEGW